MLLPFPGFYVMRLRRDAHVVPAVIYQLCPMVIPQPTTVNGPNPDDWCRPLNRSPRFAALIDGKAATVDARRGPRALPPVSTEESLPGSIPATLGASHYCYASSAPRAPQSGAAAVRL